VRDHLAAIGEKTEDVEIVNVALNGLPKYWEPFFKGVCALKNILDWQILWDDCIQEETREDSKSSKKGGSEENLALVGKMNKGKGKSYRNKGNSDGGSSHPRKKNLSKIKCFSCHKNGNYASQCLVKKKGKGKMQTIASTKTQLDDFAAKFEKDYLLVSFLTTNTATRSAWILDSNASRHMIEARGLFSSLTEKESNVHVQLGYDAKYVVKGEGTVVFHLNSRDSLDSQDVLYVPSFRKKCFQYQLWRKGVF
jgi:hypothetical protein